MSHHRSSAAVSILFTVTTVACAPEPAPPDVPVPRTYNQAITAATARQSDLAESLREAVTAGDSAAVIERAGAALAAIVADSLVPFWHGTPWTFGGATTVPGKGSIACGYFVSTLLRDAGLQVERVAMAQQASEYIIRSLVSPRYIRRFSDAPLSRVLSTVEEMGTGLYVVGLDVHTGFLLHDSSDTWFIHANYLPPRRVVREVMMASDALAYSRYRVLGYLSGDPDLLEKWLRKTPIATVRR